MVVVCCTRASRRLAVCSGVEVSVWQRGWPQGQRVAAEGYGGTPRGRRRGHVDCGGMRRVRVPNGRGVRRCAVHA